ncbi:MAG: hypothetical protein KGV44_13320, partial [Flavobacteriaceae bacterium]|nr:hypothetical protein [Flavobacteriaceae bacterium]
MSVATLAPKASTTFTATYVIKQSDVDNGKLTNTATATGTPPVKEDGTPSDPVTDDDTVTVPSDPKPSIKLEKTTDKATDYKLIKGETITYNFKVTNTGNVTLTDV